MWGVPVGGGTEGEVLRDLFIANQWTLANRRLLRDTAMAPRGAPLEATVHFFDFQVGPDSPVYTRVGAIRRATCQSRPTSSEFSGTSTRRPSRAHAGRELPLTVLPTTRRSRIGAERLFKAGRPFEWQFSTGDGKPLDETRVLRAWKATVKVAGPPARFSVRSLRHSYARQMLAKGAPITCVCRSSSDTRARRRRSTYAWALPQGTTASRPPRPRYRP